MTTSKTRFKPQPRGWDNCQVCAWLGLSTSWLRQHREVLRRAGMPQPDPVTHRTDATALERWMNRRSGLVDITTSHPSDHDASVEAIMRHSRGPSHA